MFKEAYPKDPITETENGIGTYIVNGVSWFP